METLPRLFEIFVALRYLRAKRKETAVSVVTFISIGGVAAGVAALIIALAINSGFRNTLQRNLLGATAHVSVLEKVPQYGISDWRRIASELQAIPGVSSVQPSLYQALYLSGPVTGAGAVLKGIPPETASTFDALKNLKQGSLAGLTQPQRPGFLPVILGKELARQAGIRLGTEGTLVSPSGELTPMGPRPLVRRFVCVGIFESGFYSLDVGWAFTTLDGARSVMQSEDVVNSIELKLTDPDSASRVAQASQAIIGQNLTAETWEEQNGQLLGALRMERVVTVITVGLIQFIAALNILIALTMMVMEKRRDIAILMSMGATTAQIRRIFLMQGILIGVTGTILGLIAGYTLCYFADTGRWVQLNEAIYALSYVPFESKAIDGVWVAAVAIGVSIIATLWPARNASQIAPVETLRYE